MTATGLSGQIIVEVHLLIAPGRMGAVKEELGARLERTRDNALEPLYFSYDIEDLELRICFLVSDSWLLDQYIVTVLRSVAGVQASRVRLTLNGRVFGEGISSLISDEGKLLSAHVFLHNGPEYDDAVWEALGELSSDHSGVRPVWMFRDFYEYDRAITLRLIGPSAPAIRGYLDERLGRIPGIASWRLRFMAGMVKIQSEERLMDLARLFSSVTEIRRHNTEEIKGTGGEIWGQSLNSSTARLFW